MAVKHLSISEYGTALRLKGSRLQVCYSDEKQMREYPLSRLSTLSVIKRGVSISSNLISECSLRGIRIYISAAQPRYTVCISGAHQHAVVGVRQSQFQFLDSNDNCALACKFIYGKIRNQRAVLLYFSKYLNKIGQSDAKLLIQSAAQLHKIASRIQTEAFSSVKALWSSALMGHEGQAAALYWQTLKQCNLLPSDFPGRQGRGAGDIVNQSLNLAYSILANYIWNAAINAGLEVYAGCLHANRPGKPSLVLDIMEEYRPWVVDRMILTLRNNMQFRKELNGMLKNKIIAGIHKTFSKRYPYHHKKLSLEAILQRQVYKLAGSFVSRKNYKPYLFRW